ncbi:MAG: 50S ribosome-binding GTPase, partial [Clostridia bacterium]|nr:50S ribosome-binding GTPase [Clostridia bacterium]
MKKKKTDNREIMKIALAGNPNCGKTTLFNALTGATAHVGNWTGVTVEKLEGTYRDRKADLRIDIVDLPGIYSLSPYSPEEIISRDYILSGDADLILNIVDATNLERNLYLTTQLLEIGVPIVVALNMEDCLKVNGETIDVKALSDRLGVPVVSISALKQKGIKELMQTVKENRNAQRNAISLISDTILKDSIDKVMLLLDDSKEKLFESVKLVEGDKLVSQKYASFEKDVQAIREENQEVKKKYNGNFESCVADCRYKVINEKFSDLITREKEKPAVSKSDKADKILTHRFWGIPI